MRKVNGVDIFSSVEEILNRRHSALLVVDMQNDECRPDGWFAQHGRDVSQIAAIIPRIANLVAAARVANVPAVFIQQTTLPDNRSDPPAWLYFKTRDGRRAGDYNLAGSWGHAIVDELSPGPGEARIWKHRPSAFHLTDLDLILRSLSVEAVAICGNTTQGCVLATVLDASFHNYYTTVVADGVQSFSQEQHEHALAFLGSRYDLVSAEQVSECWGKAAK